MVKQSLDNNLKEVFQAMGDTSVKNTLPRGAGEPSPTATSGKQKAHLRRKNREDYYYFQY